MGTVASLRGRRDPTMRSAGGNSLAGLLLLVAATAVLLMMLDASSSPLDVAGGMGTELEELRTDSKTPSSSSKVVEQDDPMAKVNARLNAILNNEAKDAEAMDDVLDAGEILEPKSAKHNEDEKMLTKALVHRDERKQPVAVRPSKHHHVVKKKPVTTVKKPAHSLFHKKNVMKKDVVKRKVKASVIKTPSPLKEKVSHASVHHGGLEKKKATGEVNKKAAGVKRVLQRAKKQAAATKSKLHRKEETEFKHALAKSVSDAYSHPTKWVGKHPEGETTTTHHLAVASTLVEKGLRWYHKVWDHDDDDASRKSEKQKHQHEHRYINHILQDADYYRQKKRLKTSPMPIKSLGRVPSNIKEMAVKGEANEHIAQVKARARRTKEMKAKASDPMRVLKKMHDPTLPRKQRSRLIVREFMDHLRHDDSNKKRSRRKSNKLEGVVTELEDVDLKTASVKIQNAFSQVQKRAAAVLEEFNQEDDATDSDEPPAWMDPKGPSRHPRDVNAVEDDSHNENESVSDEEERSEERSVEPPIPPAPEQHYNLSVKSKDPVGKSRPMPKRRKLTPAEKAKKKAKKAAIKKKRDARRKKRKKKEKKKAKRHQINKSYEKAAKRKKKRLKKKKAQKRAKMKAKKNKKKKKKPDPAWRK